MIRVIALFCCILFLTVSCDSGVVYQHTAAVQGTSWNYEETLDFEIPVKDTTEYYELVANIAYSSEYSFENFYAKIITVFPSGKKTDDLVSFQLANKMGSWMGTCSGDKCTSELILQERFRFREIGTHQFKITNFSREELEGIKAIEIKLYDLSKL